MSDDEMPELEDLSEQLNEIRKARGIDEKNIPKDIKIGVISEKNNNKVNIPITTSPSPQVEKPKLKQEEKPKPKIDNKRDKNKKKEVMKCDANIETDPIPGIDAPINKIDYNKKIVKKKKKKKKIMQKKKRKLKKKKKK